MNLWEHESVKEIVVAMGEEIYARVIMPDLDASSNGKFIAIDCSTADWEMGEDDLTVTKKLKARRPDAVIYALRVGHKAVFTD